MYEPREIPLPTMQTLRRAEDAKFRHARAWESLLFGNGGELKTSDELPRGTVLSQYEAMSVIEVWDDLGTDGLVDYRFQGWRLVPTKTLEQALEGPEHELLLFFGTKEEEW